MEQLLKIKKCIYCGSSVNYRNIGIFFICDCYDQCGFHICAVPESNFYKMNYFINNIWYNVMVKDEILCIRSFDQKIKHFINISNEGEEYWFNIFLKEILQTKCSETLDLFIANNNFF